MALRALKTEEEIANIPLDQEILIELPGGISEEEPEKKAEQIDPDAKQLQEQLEALKAAQKASEERERAAAEKAAKAERDAAQARKEAEDARKRQNDLEGDIISGGLSAAQGERDAAKAAFKTAFEAGDANAMAEAQSRIGRAEAKILTFESGAAEVAERKERKVEPQQTVQRQVDPMAAIDTNPNLLPAEKEWLKAHPDAVVDTGRNNELSVGYNRAMQQKLVRGSPAYFAYLEEFMGYKQPETNERDTSVQAPVTRQERDVNGRPSSNRVTLTPEEREMARNMGLSETQYAAGKVKLATKRAEDPDKYR